MNDRGMARSVARAALVLALAAAAAALPYSACAVRHATVTRAEGEALTKAEFAGLVQGLSEPGGFFHSDQMHVIEKLTRKGDQILYEVTVEDPVVLLEPWVMTPKILNVSDPSTPFGGLGVTERGNCEVYELGDITSQIRH